MNIGILSPRVLLRKGLRALLESVKDFQVILEADDSTQALQLVDLARVEAFLVDAWDLVEGFEAAAAILQKFPEAIILLLPDRIDPDLELRALKAGCQGCVSRDCDPELLEKALRAVKRGEVWISHRASSQLLKKLVRRDRQEEIGDLTRREWEILVLVAAGKRNKEIASQLCVSENTVKTHLYAIYRKLHARTRMEAALFFFQHANRQPVPSNVQPIANPDEPPLTSETKRKRQVRVADPAAGG
jgi:NarL family two-component system response regulator LiaR